MNHIVQNVLMLGCLILLPASLRAQEQQVNLQKHNLTLMEVFSEITWQTDHTLFFCHTKVDLDKRVNLSRTALPLGLLLKHLGEETAYQFQVMDTHILVMPPEFFEPVETSPLKKAPVVKNDVYAPSYRSDGGNNGVFILEMNTLAERSRGLRRKKALERDASTSVVTDTLWLFIPPLPDRVFSYSDQQLALEQTERNSGKAAEFTPRLPIGAIKINLLQGAVALAPNLSYEAALNRKMTLDLAFAYNPWDRKTHSETNKKMIHIIVKPEFRYWLCERFNGHFFGAHAFFWRYNVSHHKIPLLFKKDYQYDGHAVGMGVSYGYTWMFAQRWGVEFNAGAGVAFMRHTKKECPLCAPSMGKENKTYFGPTSLGIKLLWTLN